MMNYKKYLLYCVSLVLVLSAGYYGLFCLQFGAPIRAEYWVHDEVVLKRHIAAMMPSPKLIVMAGSNGLYGIDSKLLSDRLHLPVVNLSVYGGLPLEWLFHEINQLARPGDIVVLPLEWEYYTMGFAAHAGPLVKQIIAWDKDYFYSLSFYQQARLIRAENYTELINVLLRKFHQQKILRKHPEKKVYSIETVLEHYYSAPRPQTFSLNYLNNNEQGDMMNTCKKPAKKITLLDTATYTLDVTPIASNFVLIQRAVEQLEKRGIKTFVTFPPMFQNAHVTTAVGHATLQKIIAELAAHHIKTLGNPADYFFAREDFFDTHYHLQCDARKRRTDRLALQLKMAL